MADATSLTTKLYLLNISTVSGFKAAGGIIISLGSGGRIRP